MGLRFSIRWALAAMAYAALAAAAFAQAHWSYADFLWIATFCAIAYGWTLAIFARGRRQAAAAGFSVASALLILCLQFAPDSLPIARLMLAALPDPSLGQPWQPYPTAPVAAPYATASIPTTQQVLPNLQAGGTLVIGGGSFVGGSGMGWGQTISTYATPSAAAAEQEKFLVRIRAANIVATMLAGLVGCVLGAAAFPRNRSKESAA